MDTTFKPGKLTLVIDGGAGSSAKGLRAANIWATQKHTHTTFAVNTFMSNAAHTITHQNGAETIHQCLSSITTLKDYEKQYISPGSVFSLQEILNEIDQHNITPKQLGIHPLATIVTQKDINYEKGTHDFEGNPKQNQDSANLQIGSTLHGVGAARARKILRRPDVTLAKHCRELIPYLSNTNEEIMERLNKGESGLAEIAQGYQLSLNSNYYPKVTSRNVSIAAFLDDALLPITTAGPTIINFRTYPIRVNNNKYIHAITGEILNHHTIKTTPPNLIRTIKGDSGGHYPDQKELTWEEISQQAGTKIEELTSLTKLPRRVFTFSQINLHEALKYNNTNNNIYISINFINYIDNTITPNNTLTPKTKKWLNDNIITQELFNHCHKWNINLKGIYLGYGKTIPDSKYYTIEELTAQL